LEGSHRSQLEVETALPTPCAIRRGLIVSWSKRNDSGYYLPRGSGNRPDSTLMIALHTGLLMLRCGMSGIAINAGERCRKIATARIEMQTPSLLERPTVAADHTPPSPMISQASRSKASDVSASPSLTSNGGLGTYHQRSNEKTTRPVGVSPADGSPGKNDLSRGQKEGGGVYCE